MSSFFIGYPITREDRRWYEGRGAYLIDRTPGADAPQLCHVMERAARAARPNLVIDPSWRGFPWLTFVLGSGAVAIADEPGLSPTAVARRVEEHLTKILAGFREIPPANVSLSYTSQASAFTEALVRDRLAQDQPTALEADAPDATAEWELLPVAAELTLIAALLTGWFNRARAETHAPLTRWDDDEAVLGPPGTDGALDLESEYLQPAAHLINHVMDQLDGGTSGVPGKVAKAVSALLDVISRRLQPGRGRSSKLRIEHLRLLTEVCWQFLLLQTAVYPGWTDLLLGLMLQEKDNQGFRKSKPRFSNLENLPGYVGELVSRPTERSWELSEAAASGGAMGLRDSLYCAIAEVLWLQAATTAADRSLPPAVAFVTSFDIEVEMGLWLSAVTSDRSGRSAFNVVIPVHVFRDRAALEAEPCWLIGEVRPNGDLSWAKQREQLMVPGNWRLLPQQSGAMDLLRGRPTVVHLSGCPLFEEPDLRQCDALVRDLRDVDVAVKVDEAVLVHAVTVDEYLALRQAEAEFFFMLSNDQHAGTGRGLPRELTADGDLNPRFWMALGVPIGDPAIRHRLVAQMALRQLFHSTSDSSHQGGGLLGTSAAPQPRSERRGVDGVVINRRISDNEASLLYWLGLDVVQANCEDFIGDIRHHAAHLSDPGPRRRTEIARHCPIARASANRR